MLIYCIHVQLQYHVIHNYSQSCLVYTHSTYQLKRERLSILHCGKPPYIQLISVGQFTYLHIVHIHTIIPPTTHSRDIYDCQDHDNRTLTSPTDYVVHSPYHLFDHIVPSTITTTRSPIHSPRREISLSWRWQGIHNPLYS